MVHGRDHTSSWQAENESDSIFDFILSLFLRRLSDKLGSILPVLCEFNVIIFGFGQTENVIFHSALVDFQVRWETCHVRSWDYCHPTHQFIISHSSDPIVVVGMGHRLQILIWPYSKEMTDITMIELQLRRYLTWRMSGLSDCSSFPRRHILVTWIDHVSHTLMRKFLRMAHCPAIVFLL